MQQTTRGWRERLAVVLGCLSARCGEAGPRCELEFGRRRVVVRPRGCMFRRVAGLPMHAGGLLVSYRPLARFIFQAANSVPRRTSGVVGQLLLKLIGGDAQQRSCSGNDRWRLCNHIGTARVLRREDMATVSFDTSG